MGSGGGVGGRQVMKVVAMGGWVAIGGEGLRDCGVRCSVLCCTKMASLLTLPRSAVGPGSVASATSSLILHTMEYILSHTRVAILAGGCRVGVIPEDFYIHMNVDWTIY